MMLKTVERKKLEAGKIKMVHFDAECLDGKARVYGRKTRHGIQRAFVSMDEKEFTRVFGAERLFSVEFPVQLVAAVNMARDLFSYGHDFTFAFDPSGGWSYRYSDHYEMDSEDGNRDGMELEFTVNDPDGMEDVYQVVSQFRSVDVYMTKLGAYAFKVADIDDGAGLYCLKGFKTVKMMEAEKNAA